MKMIVGLVVLCLGVLSFGTALYIDKQVGEGKVKIAKGERQIRQVETVTKMDPKTALMGEAMTASGKEKIAKGRQDVAWYESLSGWLKVGGGVFVLLGGAIAVFGKKE
jgi:hypothetical protein